jgi:enoyl-CoA hydratase/carnithine racemase
MFNTINLEIQDHVGIITLNTPETRNTLSREMIDELVTALGESSVELNVRCLVLTGAGSAFCAGGNINDMRDRTDYAGGGPINGWRSMLAGFQRIPRAFLALDIPVIAAVNGPAMGAGCDLATMCDIRIASESAKFAESFVRLGVVSGDGGAWFLTRAVGRSRAAEMTFTGDAIDAVTAGAWGLVSKVVSGTELMPQALALANRIAQNPPNAIRMAKRLLRDAAESDAQHSLELAATMQGVLLHTDDQREAVKAMLEKRLGNYRGT